MSGASRVAFKKTKSFVLGSVQWLIDYCKEVKLKLKQVKEARGLKGVCLFIFKDLSLTTLWAMILFITIYGCTMIFIVLMSIMFEVPVIGTLAFAITTGVVNGIVFILHILQYIVAILFVLSLIALLVYISVYIYEKIKGERVWEIQVVQ